MNITITVIDALMAIKRFQSFDDPQYRYGDGRRISRTKIRAMTDAGLVLMTGSKVAISQRGLDVLAAFNLGKRYA